MAEFINVRPSLPQPRGRLDEPRPLLRTIDDMRERVRSLAPREPEIAERPRPSTPTKKTLG